MKRKITRKGLSVILSVLSLFNLSSQVFWSEDFGTFNSNDFKTILAENYNSNGQWTVTELSPNGTNPNKWFISSIEAGVGSGNCSNGYNKDHALLNNTLHISRGSLRSNEFASEKITDFGAKYSKGKNSLSDFRIETPKIVCTNKANITFSFDYFCGGEPGSDEFSVYYFDGVVWNLLTTLGATNNGSCNNNSALWKKSDTYILPPSANNNPVVKIGFRWKNAILSRVDSSNVSSGPLTADILNPQDTSKIASNVSPTDSITVINTGSTGLNHNDSTISNASGTHTSDSVIITSPAILINQSIVNYISVAIDNITVSGSTYVDPNNNVNRTANTNRIDIKTKTSADKKNNPTIVFTTYYEKFPANDLIVESSTDGTDFNELSKIKSKAVKSGVTKLEYNFTDAEANDGVNYYRIKQVNADKTTVISKIVSVDHIKAKNITFTVYPNPNSGQFTVDFSGIENNHEVQIVLNDMNDGHEIYSTTFYSNSIDSNKMDVNPPTKIAPGRYICSLIFEGIRSSVIVMIN
jgi:hypothetical protein